MEKNKTFEDIIEEFFKERSLYIKNMEKEKMSYKIILKLQKEIDNNKPILSKKLVNTCLIKTLWESETNRAHRITKLRVLSIFMIRMGYKSVVIPKGIASQPDYSYTPYIFSNIELKNFIKATEYYCTNTINCIHKGKAFIIVFDLLIGSGLRITETLNLKKNDIDFKKCTIFLTKTKNSKERKIPIASSTMNKIEKYMKELDADSFYQKFPYLFVNWKGNVFNSDDAYKLFRKILWKANIPHQGRGKGPRIHDLRHSYGVHILAKWVHEGHNLTTALPYLSTYMGHGSLKASEHYLRIANSMYPELTQAFDDCYGWIIDNTNKGICKNEKN